MLVVDGEWAVGGVDGIVSFCVFGGTRKVARGREEVGCLNVVVCYPMASWYQQREFPLQGSATPEVIPPVLGQA